MNRSLTAQSLYDQLRVKLDLHWVAGRRGAERYIRPESILLTRPALAGYLNMIHPNKVQVIGREEAEYLEQLSESARAKTISRIVSPDVLAIVVADDLSVAGELADLADERDTPLFMTPQPGYQAVNFLQYHLSRALARSTHQHGVFMEIFTIGVLITGDPASGKSELALELLNRGHRLVADDAPEFTQISPEVIDGTCPPALQDCLEVRGLGVLNIREMFGDAAIKMNKYLRLVVHLQLPENRDPDKPSDRLQGDLDHLAVLDLQIPRITLPVMPGRNLAIMTEAAVRDFMLKMKGYDASAAFTERHARLLRQGGRGDHE